MTIKIDVIVTEKLGFASQQNAVPVLRELEITNNSESDYDDLMLVLSASPAFLEGKTWKIDRLPKGDSLHITDRDLKLNAAYLADLSESLRGELKLLLCCADQTLAEDTFEIEILANNEWGGAGVMPELLAAFAMPNDPAVDRLLKAASDVLRRAGKKDSIDGYSGQSRTRTWELTSALWSSVCGLKLSYALPPSSFEMQGQKVRTPSKVLDGGVATCLDTALLFAALAEQAGLNPLLLLTKGHAFVGVWLQPQEFSQLITDEASAVRKRIELNELLVFETTLATQAIPPSFSQAVEAAKRQVNDDDFIMAIDLRRARMQRIRPLALFGQRFQFDQSVAENPVSIDALEEAPLLPSFDVEIQIEPDSPASKLNLWRRKLLDLTTRNRLLHLPDGAKCVRLICPDLAKLEDILADGKRIRVVAMPDLEAGGRDTALYEQQNRENLRDEYARSALNRNEVLGTLEKTKLDTALVDLYRTARSDLDEGGANTLFLAIGLLKWKKSVDDQKSYSAPLILLPIKLERKSALSGVTMSMLDEEPRFNLTLLELLRHDFELNIPGLDGELPTDESGIDVEGVWNAVRRAVRDIPGFEVTHELVLGTFSFAKYLMWKDLSDRSEQLLKSPLVKHLLERQAEGSDAISYKDFPRAEGLDQRITPAQLFTPLPADSSQLAAVVASTAGHSFVLDGPPGTGKSQTIANMIAHNLALGRRVLFVAEKMAALDVVYRRLEEKGLGEFCLELHSSKTSKVSVLKQLERAWDTRELLSAEEWSTEAAQVQRLRDKLNGVVSLLHKRWPNGLSVHQAMGRVIHHGCPAIPRLNWPDGTTHDLPAMTQLRDVARRLDLNSAAGQALSTSFKLLSQIDWSNGWQEALVAASHELSTAINELNDTQENFIQGSQLPLKASEYNEIARVVRFSEVLEKTHGVDLVFSFSANAAAKVAAARQAIALINEYRKLDPELSFPPATNVKSSVVAARQAIVLINDYRELDSEFLFPSTANIKSSVAVARKVIALIIEYRKLAPDLLSSSTENIKSTVKAVRQAIVHINEYRKLESELSLAYSAEACRRINLEKIERDWAQAEGKFWFLAAFAKKKIGRQLSMEGGAVGMPDVVADLAKLRKLKLLLGELDALHLELDGIPGWAILGSNLSKMGGVLQLLAELDTLSIDLQGVPGWAFLGSNLSKMEAALRLLSELDALSVGLQGVPGWAFLGSNLSKMDAALRLLGELDALSIELQGIPGWASLSSNISQMDAALLLSDNLRSAISAMAQSPEHSVELRSATSRLVVDANELLGGDGAIISAINRFKSAFARLTNALERFKLLSTDDAEINADLASLCDTADDICRLEAQLKSWCDWCRVRYEAQELGLKPLADAVAENALPVGGALEIFETAYARWFATQVIDAEPLLRNFVSAEHMSDIDAYRQKEDHLSKLSVRYVRAKLCGLIPSKNDTGKQGGFAILKHELQKSRRHKPVRQLAVEMGDAMQKLAPCMLMSPLSIAQYLPADLALFDLVIFDEASQIAPWDAIGSIARGKQVVIAGDPRQMPPTSFFNRGASASEDDTEDDMESILDECLGAGIPSHSLSWHYRSRHESLIAFSNHRYYESNLITFPAPETRASAVEWRYVDGVYSRGKGRNNQAEAEAMVAETVRRLTDPQFVAQGLSIGIITLNSDQQTLVTNLLDLARQKHPEIEPFFQEDLAEPVVVKNLETVQGDERDLIMFGIGYGPAEPGLKTMSMNFGPLNKEGGWRRLNVAVTRARREMLVFTSFDSAMVDLNRTSARAVRDLKHFIEFASRGPRALAEAVQGSVGGYESPFEEAVAEGLRRKGWEVIPQIGVSRFRIDLGIVNPDRPGDYLLGVECDGATYHSAATARDRDKVRSAILQGLGWKLLRVWSTDWWIDKEGALERLHAAINTHLEVSRATPRPTFTVIVPEIITPQLEKSSVEEKMLVDKPPVSALSDTVTSEQKAEPYFARSIDNYAVVSAKKYRVTDFSDLIHQINPEKFYSDEYDAILASLIDRVLAHEAPILDSLLMQRIARVHGFQRSGRLIRERIIKLVERKYHMQLDSADAVFVWTDEQHRQSWASYRTPATEDDVRSIEEIVTEELKAAASVVSTEDKALEIARLFGVRRLTSSARNKIEDAIMA
ncbi:hypothetical protein JHS3_07340 [Jeongeupia sp. HS-3]|uniref:DUF3320 domain-containing protein n=1 Tax=Jeongeupia sp. HS-3 TaxID=1009682 RepID=UPI0018A4637B|nr:DUF3320 domain-containing protein [Jeongeupia sp. HS-3]BCL74998.1 hypothetical protein JHS3_07340 [Jeongeupia sp. HS-3]